MRPFCLCPTKVRSSIDRTVALTFSLEPIATGLIRNAQLQRVRLQASPVLVLEPSRTRPVAVSPLPYLRPSSLLAGWQEVLHPPTSDEQAVSLFSPWPSFLSLYISWPWLPSLFPYPLTMMTPSEAHFPQIGITQTTTL